jgi:hypothetical protein
MPAQPSQLAYALRALGRRELPQQFTLNSIPYHLTRPIKHDFFAATAFYATDDVSTPHREVVLKAGRTEPFAGVPLKWLGRWLCWREMRFYTRAADIKNVPALLGTVGETGFVHAFVPGRPLSKDRPVPDHFFDRLRELIAELHRRDIAYVDANKPENILLGDDELPHLIDFQISWDLFELGNNFLNRWWLRRLQRADIYHVLKHKKRLRPDETTEDERRVVERRSTLIRVHRFITKPYFKLRRRTFKRLRDTGQLFPEGSK